MTRTAYLSVLARAALLLGIAGYGCGGSSDTLPGDGTGGRTQVGTGGAFVGGTGGVFGGASGGDNGGDHGTGGSQISGSGGESGERDAGMRPDGGKKPRDAGVHPDTARMPPDAGTATDGGEIRMCTAGARCTVGKPEPTCNEPCKAGREAGERVCTCVRPGVVACGLCRRVADGGAD